MADPNRFKFDADEFYLKTPAEMRDLWRDLPEACDNTLPSPSAATCGSPRAAT